MYKVVYNQSLEEVEKVAVQSQRCRRRDIAGTSFGEEIKVEQVRAAAGKFKGLVSGNVLDQPTMVLTRTAEQDAG